MALIRTVAQHPGHGRWGYIEFSDEDKNFLPIELGSKNFGTKKEAEEFSLGFELFSYVWVEPKEIKKKRLNTEKELLERKLELINKELSENT